MRKITHKAASVFLEYCIKEQIHSLGNTVVYKNKDNCGRTYMYLHGRRIATLNTIGKTYSNQQKLRVLRLEFAGKPTKLTRERLNGILELIEADHRLQQKQGVQYYGPCKLGLGLHEFYPYKLDESITTQMRKNENYRHSPRGY